MTEVPILSLVSPTKVFKTQKYSTHDVLIERKKLQKNGIVFYDFVSLYYIPKYQLVF